ncbi:integrin alpha-PS4-like [Neocloeon triangulifer]|uniref:integrin alpha-PS4-like n=1 Tax=Neocloeon triangulifer TaxID=2078957 RepID=UPI00286F9086|nr:integrin alpha-PS4-like [Neocloeon triangulifer]
MLVLLLVVLSAAVHVATPFNVDTEFATVVRNPHGAAENYFGFSVALRRALPGTAWNSWLLVGAPRANSTFPQQVNLHQPGAVFECRLHDGELENRCQSLPFDTTGEDRVFRPNGFSYHHKKDDAWLGSTIAVEDEPNGRTVICGPRWINKYYEDVYLMNGVCYWYDRGSFMTSAAQILTPLIEKKKQAYNTPSDKPGVQDTKVFNYAYGGAGIAAEFIKSENKSELIIGAPGVFDWKGTIVRYRSLEDDSKEQTVYDDPAVPSPKSVAAIPYLGYFGYSVGAAQFFPGDSKAYYVSGAPRAADYKGKVMLYSVPEYDDEELKVLYELEGQQMGEYFGASLCVADVNGDGQPDLVVGAPQHSLPAQSSTDLSQGEEGRIYVFINELVSLRQGSFRTMGNKYQLMGSQKSGARFGTTVVSLGDINLDGFHDVAVGAPYEDEGRGAVYVYHGRRSGLEVKFAQRIAAREVDGGLRGFGVSLSRGVDVDGNAYPDFAVGAHASGHAVLFRSRPVVVFNGNIRPSVDRIAFNATAFKANACLSYVGNHAPNFIDAKITVTADPVFKRAVFVTPSGKTNSFTFTTRLKLQTPVCQELNVEIIQTSNQDFSKPIDLQVESEIDNSKVRSRRQVGGGRGFCKSCAVIDPNSLAVVRARVPYSTGCRKDDVCETDLKVAATLTQSTPVAIGSVKRLGVTLEVTNDGEPAFLAQLVVRLPPDAPLARVPKNCLEANEKLTCDIGNPLPSKAKASIELELEMANIAPGTKSLSVAVNATSAGDDLNLADNLHNLTIPLVTEADIAVTGKSVLLTYFVDWHNESATNEAISLVHTYEVTNYGPSPVDRVHLLMALPFQVEVNNRLETFLEIKTPKAYLDGEEFLCSTKEGEGVEKRTKRAAKEAATGHVPANRTLFLNCTQANVRCVVVECLVGPLAGPNTPAVVSFALTAHISKLRGLLGEKDVIWFASSGMATLVEGSRATQPADDRPDGHVVHTLFLGTIPDKGVPTWMIALAIILGVLILLLIILALVKLGFFRRDKKDELEALKNKKLLEDEFGPDMD